MNTGSNAIDPIAYKRLELANEELYYDCLKRTIWENPKMPFHKRYSYARGLAVSARKCLKLTREIDELEALKTVETELSNLKIN